VVVAWLIAVKKSRNWESLTSMRLKTLILEKCAKRNNADGGDREEALYKMDRINRSM
jgi:hypothetical protein